jgi:hypothetical protein
MDPTKTSACPTDFLVAYGNFVKIVDEGNLSISAGFSVFRDGWTKISIGNYMLFQFE